MKILVVEDDELVARALTNVLTGYHYAVEVATDGLTGWELVQSYDYDLVLLDVELPRLDGITFCRQLRSQNQKIPVLLLTGRVSGHDKALGLDAGADDYVVKPFDVEELMARVRALLRRSSVVAAPVLEWGELKLDPNICEVTYQDQLLTLTSKEFSLLELFLRNSRRVFSCGMILEHLWSYETTPSEEAVRTHIKCLRQKLKFAGLPPDLIETVYGIGYRLKPLQKPTTAESTKKSPSRQQTLAAIAGVWERCKPKVREQVGVLEQLAAAPSPQAISPVLWQKATREAHTLAGSLGTFGYPEGSRLCRKIESLLEQNRTLTELEFTRLQKWVVNLRQVIERPLLETEAEPAESVEPLPLLLVIDPDPALTQQLMIEAPVWDFRAVSVSELAAARQQIQQDRPQVVLLDPYFSGNLEDGLALLAELNQQQPAVPVLVLTTQSGLNDRLEVARLGGRRFLPKPIATVQIWEAVNQVLHTQETIEAKVLVVDDDVQLLIALRALLTPWGFQVITLDDPRQFWAVLESTAPDLVILDVEMPHVSGIELCQVVRNDSQWSGLPILFLTAHTDATIVNQVFTIGADDFVTKPIVGPELVTRILNRLERIKLLRGLSETDPLTRVSNRHKFTTELERFIQLAKQQKQPLCFTVLDLDCFKQVNDTYGHLMGDEVLRQLGQLLSRSFRSEDVVARWGGEEFVIGMYGCSRDNGLQRIHRLLQTLRQREFVTEDGKTFRVTFSAGVAHFPEDGQDLRSLYRAADTAMYQAKAQGRDRVIAASPSERDGDERSLSCLS